LGRDTRKKERKKKRGGVAGPKERVSRGERNTDRKLEERREEEEERRRREKRYSLVLLFFSKTKAGGCLQGRRRYRYGLVQSDLPQSGFGF
jgi:hypothetical protein